MLVARDGADFRLGPALFWAASWALGAGIGIALGGWLTLVGGAGAPGADALDPFSDLLVVPGMTFVGVLLLHLIGQLVAAMLRGRAIARGQ